jgi:ssDNA-binding Zn-finger/Zn-ribbon topoisomerase 1
MQKNLVICPVCRGPMGLEKGRFGLVYKCLNYPKCDVTHSATKNGTPLGFPSDARTRKARCELHDLMAKVWDYKNNDERAKMYSWLGQNSKYGHISMMSFGEIQQVMIKVNKLLAKKTQ